MVRQWRSDGGIATRGHICEIIRAAVVQVTKTSGSHDARERVQKQPGEGTPAKLVDRGPELEARGVLACMYQVGIEGIGRVRFGCDGTMEEVRRKASYI